MYPHTISAPKLLWPKHIPSEDAIHSCILHMQKSVRAISHLQKCGIACFVFFLSQSQRNNYPLCWGLRKERKLYILIFFFSWSLELKILELRSSYHNQVSDRERILAQANCSMSRFGKAEEVNYVSSATAFLRVRQSQKAAAWLCLFFCKDQAIGCFDQSLKSACPVQNSAMKKSPSPKLRRDLENAEVLKYVCVNVKHAHCWLCHREQHVLVVKGKQEEISAAHLQTRLSARIDASREAWKETTGQATLYFLSKALSLTKKAKLIMLGAHILQACCNAQRA